MLNHIRNVFLSTSFLYENPKQVSILTGQNEGFYSWVAANYLLNNFELSVLEFHFIFSNFCSDCKFILKYKYTFTAIRT